MPFTKDEKIHFPLEFNHRYRRTGLSGDLHMIVDVCGFHEKEIEL
jgi:hypothetical protein